MENKPTLLSQNIDAASYSPELDNTCKKLLSHRIILAMILCEVTKEFQGITPQEAVKYIDTPHISTDALDPDIPDVITGDDKESLSVMSKETRTFDINFTATVPNTENKIELIINIEAQGRNAVGYPILKRGIYYCSRLISDQYGKVFKNSEYEKIKKVYSIWICLHPDPAHRNTVIKYSITPEDIIGNPPHDKEEELQYDLISLILINLGYDKGENFKGILRFLKIYLSGSYTAAQKKEILETDYGLKMTEKVIEEDMANMCNISTGIYEEGKECGIEIGKEYGIEIGKEQGELKKSITTAISMIKDNLSDDKVVLYTELPISSVQMIRRQLDKGVEDIQEIMNLL